MLVPPMITAAMMVNSVPEPELGCALANLEAIRTPAKAAKVETRI